MRRRAQVYISAENFSRQLDLPEGTLITDIRYDALTDTVRICLAGGNLPETPEGSESTLIGLDYGHAS